MGTEFEPILKAYLAAAIWTDETLEDENGETVLPEGLTIYDFSDESVEQARKDISAFMEQAKQTWPMIEEIDPERVGHDLWLTRNGHGSGFWDGREFYGTHGDTLSEIARMLKPLAVVEAGSGKLYFE